VPGGRRAPRAGGFRQLELLCQQEIVSASCSDSSSNSSSGGGGGWRAVSFRAMLAGKTAAGFALGYGVTMMVALLAVQLHRRRKEQQRRHVSQFSPYTHGLLALADRVAELLYVV